MFRSILLPLTLAVTISPLVAMPQPPPVPPLPPPPVPIQNPITQAKIQLGKTLFFEEQLSADRTVSCATCHMPEAGGSDPRSLNNPYAVFPGADGQFGTADDVHGSPGVVRQAADGTYLTDATFPYQPAVTRRKSQSVLMSAYPRQLFWDGRAGERFNDPVSGQTLIPAGAALETQASMPPLDEGEMAHVGADWSSIAARISTARPLALAESVPPILAAWLAQRSYPDLFQEAFGTAVVTPARIAMALATYQRTLVPNQAPIDAFAAGNMAALTVPERRGLMVFMGAGQCNTCHTAPTFDRPDFFHIGVRPVAEDRGRGALTGIPADMGAFRVPSLRNVVSRAPYFHNGSFTTLAEVIDFYDRGGDFRRNQTPLITPLQLTPQQRADLLAFLSNALTDPRVTAGVAPFDHPRLYGQSNRVPTTYGTGTPGTGGITPRLVAYGPAILGNDRLGFGIHGGLGGAPALLLLDLLAGSGQPFLGIPLQVAASPALLALDLGPLQGVGSGAGHVPLLLSIPNDHSLVGANLHGQAVVADVAGPQGLAATAGLRFTVFGAR